MLKNISNKLLLILFAVFYAYSLLAGIAFQKLLPMLLPHMVAPGSSLTADSAYFHQIAINLANEVNDKGWGVWSLFPNSYTSFNVAIMGALYALFGVNSLLAVPINALFHALSGVILYCIAVELSGIKYNGKIAGLIVSVAFVIFPSALNWYGQIHKDGFVIFGVFFYVYILVLFLKNHRSISVNKIFVYSVYNFAALLFIGIVRPYYLKPLLVFVIIFLGFSLWSALSKRGGGKKLLAYAVVTLLLVLLNSKLVVMLGATEAQLGETYAASESLQFDKRIADKRVAKKGKSGFCDGVLADVCRNFSFIEDQVYLYYSIIEDRAYLYYSIIDEQLENNAKILAETRYKLNEYSKSVNSKSSIDIDVNFHNFNDVLSYVPRALQIAVFAPFPNSWLEDFSPARLVAVVEMIFIYVALIGIVFLYRINSRVEVTFVILFSLNFLVIYGLTIGNVGTLYRVRYSFEFLLILLGVVGWCGLLREKRSEK